MFQLGILEYFCLEFLVSLLIANYQRYIGVCINDSCDQNLIMT